MQTSLIRLWIIGGVAGLAAALLEVLVLQGLAWLDARPAGDILRSLTTIAGIGSASPSSGLVRGLAAIALLLTATLLGLAFIAIVRDFHGLAATPGTLVIAGATFSAMLWWIVYSVAWASSPIVARSSPTPQLAAALFFGAVLGALVAFSGVRQSPGLE